MGHGTDEGVRMEDGRIEVLWHIHNIATVPQNTPPMQKARLNAISPEKGLSYIEANDDDKKTQL
jgi:hypothetical protein